MEQKPNYYAIIPASVRYADISPNAKLLYGEITALSQKEGYCWSGNGYFSKLYDVDPRSIKRWLSELVHLGVIKVEIDQSRGNERKIYLVTELSLPSDKNVPTPSDKNVPYNNTSSNIKSKDISSASQTGLPDRARGEAPNPDSAPPKPGILVDNTFRGLVAILHPDQKLLFTPGRKSKLNARLKNFDQKQLCDAAKNLMASEWHTGKNPTNKKYASLDFLIRNDEKVEEWLTNKPVTLKKSAF